MLLSFFWLTLFVNDNRYLNADEQDDENIDLEPAILKTASGHQMFSFGADENKPPTANNINNNYTSTFDFAPKPPPAPRGQFAPAQAQI